MIYDIPPVTTVKQAYMSEFGNKSNNLNYKNMQAATSYRLKRRK